jgi:hypothetical protein
MLILAASGASIFAGLLIGGIVLAVVIGFAVWITGT